MRPFLIILLLFFTRSVCANSLESEFKDSILQNSSSDRIEINLLAEQLFGNTEYILRAKSDLGNGSGNLSDLRSQLVFPLDAFNMGLGISYSTVTKSNRKWTFTGILSYTENDPSKMMIDDDWIDDEKVSMTNSAVELQMIKMIFEARVQLIRQGKYNITGYSQISNQNIWEDIIGYEGWYKDENGDIFDQFESEAAISYGINYLNFASGAGLDWSPEEKINFKLQAAAGLLFAKDYDDHLLRGRVAEGKGVGYSILSAGSLTYYPGTKAKGKFAIGLTAKLSYYHANGKQDMEWYQYENGIEPGTRLEGIPHEFQSLQFSIGIQAGIVL